MRKKSIAIIGGGGAGATAAWALSKVHNISLFEMENTLGGHAYTETLEINGHRVKVDLGVEYFSEKQAPNLYTLLNHFKIDTFIAPLSFGAASKEKNDEFWTNTHIKGPIWEKISRECSRFHAQMHEIIHLDNPIVQKTTLGQFLKQENYSKDFIYKALLPLLTTFSSGNSQTLAYSLTFCAISFSMGLLSFFHPTYWRKSEEGIGNYLSKISQELGDKIHLNSKVVKVERDSNCVLIYVDKKPPLKFDEVIFATHADTTLSMISNPTDEEKNILGHFEYTPIECVLHSDLSILTKKFNATIYCEFTYKQHEDRFIGSLTRVINCLDPYKHIETPILVTFDPKFTISDQYIYLKKYWKIPKLRPQDMSNKKNIRKLQGKNHFWFCGTDTSLTGHEGAIVSGLVVADALGAYYPFSHNNWATMQFNIVKNIMGIYTPYEQVTNIITNSIYFIAKSLGLHKSQVSKVFLDFYA